MGRRKIKGVSNSSERHQKGGAGALGPGGKSGRGTFRIPFRFLGSSSFSGRVFSPSVLGQGTLRKRQIGRKHLLGRWGPIPANKPLSAEPGDGAR